MITFRDITFAISDTSDVSEIFPFIAWMIFSRKGLPYSILGIYFLISGTVKIFTLVTAELRINNMPAYHLLSFLEIATVYSFYSMLTLKKINPWVITALFCLYAANSIFIQPVFTFNSLSWTTSMVLIVVIGMVYFYQIYKREEDTTSLGERPDFIITAAWLIYASGSLFTYLMGTDILSGNPDGFFKNAWIFQCISNILKNMIICYGFWLTSRACQKLPI